MRSARVNCRAVPDRTVLASLPEAETPHPIIRSTTALVHADHHDRWLIPHYASKDFCGADGDDTFVFEPL